MTDREKLTELFEEANAKCARTKCPECEYDGDECWDKFLIDYLLANGVTFQTWIPVSERLPELHTKVLCCGIRGGRFIAELTTWGNGNQSWDKHTGKGCPEVTHWMPLPEPPKEEM